MSAMTKENQPQQQQQLWGIHSHCHESPLHRTIMTNSLTQSHFFRSRTLPKRSSSKHSHHASTYQLTQTLKAQTNSKMVRDMTREVQVLEHTPGLVENIFKLKQMNLLKEKNLFVTKYSEVPKCPVYNDYHSRETNPGYSRNKLGGFFTK